MRLRTSATVVAALALALPVLAHAQALSDIASTGSSPFSLSVSPDYPAPYSQATITPYSGDVDLSTASITVTVGGAKVYQGNAQPFSIQLGAAGVPVTVNVTATADGAQTSEQTVIVPEDVAVVAEPLASAPPLYLGKPLVPIDGDVRVVSVARLVESGVVLSPAALSYEWTVDGVDDTADSGIGKEAIIVPSPLQYRERDVSVVVTSQDGNVIGGGDVELNSETPTVRIYEDDPLLGIRFDHALSGSYQLTNAEETLYGAPFSFDIENGTPSLTWSVNGGEAQTGDLITLRPTGSGEGSAAVSLAAMGDDPTAAASASLTLSYGSSNSTGVFGL